MLNPDEITVAIELNDPVQLVAVMKKYNLTIKENRIVADPKIADESAEYWDRMQLIKKILLNS